MQLFVIELFDLYDICGVKSTVFTIQVKWTLFVIEIMKLRNNELFFFIATFASVRECFHLEVIFSFKESQKAWTCPCHKSLFDMFSELWRVRCLHFVNISIYNQTSLEFLYWDRRYYIIIFVINDCRWKSTIRTFKNNKSISISQAQ